MELSQLLPLLRANGVKVYKTKELQIEFDSAPLPEAPKPEQPAPALQAVPDLPQDLKADDTMNYDKILNWSGSPDQEPGEALPMTGDAPIESAA